MQVTVGTFQVIIPDDCLRVLSDGDRESIKDTMRSFNGDRELFEQWRVELFATIAEKMAE